MVTGKIFSKIFPYRKIFKFKAFCRGYTEFYKAFMTKQEKNEITESYAKMMFDGDVSTFNSFEKIQMIKSKLKELNKVFKNFNIPKNKMLLLRDTIESMANTIVNIKDVEGVILRKGSIIKYNNGGGQSGKTKNPAVDILKSYKGIYNADVKLLFDIINSEQKILTPKDEDVLMNFINMK